MADHDIAIDDLYTRALGRMDEIHKPNGVHFTKDGSRYLADKVAQSLRDVLK